MKIITLIFTILIISINAYAIDFTTVNEESIAVFMKLFPEYKKISMEYGKQVESQNVIQSGFEYNEKFQALFKKYGITTEEFPNLMKKITLGLASIQMKNSGLPTDMFGMNELGAGLNPEEENILKAHMDDIQKILEDE